jgi:hypothetical protein
MRIPIATYAMTTPGPESPTNGKFGFEAGRRANIIATLTKA